VVPETAVGFVSQSVAAPTVRRLAPISTGIRHNLNGLCRKNINGSRYSPGHHVVAGGRLSKFCGLSRRVTNREAVSAVALRHDVAANLVFRWRRLMSEGGRIAVSSDEMVVSNSEVRKFEERVRELERLWPALKKWSRLSDVSALGTN